jgi:hypothetical protein
VSNKRTIAVAWPNTCDSRPIAFGQGTRGTFKRGTSVPVSRARVCHGAQTDRPGFKILISIAPRQKLSAECRDRRTLRVALCRAPGGRYGRAMSSTGAIVLVVSLGVGIPLLVATILAVVFRSVARATARERAALDREGVILDSGPLWITVRYTNFRAPGIYRGAAVSKTRGSFVLTRERLVLTPGFRRVRLRVSRSDLVRFTVGIGEGGVLRLHSDDPPGASGSIDYRVPVDDATSWVKALADAGARSSKAGTVVG